jgi:hypothetical protein
MAQAELITSKDWVKKLADSKEAKKNPLIAAMAEYLGKGAGQAAGAKNNDQ